MDRAQPITHLPCPIVHATNTRAPLLPRTAAFRTGRLGTRPPIEGEWTYLWLDATDLKVRENGRIVLVAAIIATGVNTDGRREILGLGLGPSDAAIVWLGFLRGLE